MTGDGATPGPEGGGPVPTAPAPQTLLARCVVSAARCIAGVGTMVAFNVSVSSSVSHVCNCGIAVDLASERRLHGNCLKGLRAALNYNRSQ